MRSSYWIRQTPALRKTPRRRVLADAALVERISLTIASFSSYGFSWVWALLRCLAELKARPVVDANRVYRVMHVHGLLLGLRRKQPGVARRHADHVALSRATPVGVRMASNSVAMTSTGCE